MNTTFRLRDLGISHLDYVFNPAGLPLVNKGDNKGGTTSVLVRGSAGSGKTTLALALAHSIAKHHGGVVLCLSTEFSAAEVVFKAQVLGLQDGTVFAWPGKEDLPAGTILVQSLSVLDVADKIDGSVSRKIATFDALHGLLEPKEGSYIPPVRAIVLDALALPDTGDEEGILRERLLEMIQALEHRGISTIVVEEAAPGASEWAAFVVDIVIELLLVPDPDTGELNRKLACRKCRYAFSIPGPHNYGLDGLRPAVWPNILSFIDSTPELKIQPLPMVVPCHSPDDWTFFSSGGIALSQYDRTNLQLHWALSVIPGATLVHAECGPMSVVTSSKLSTSVPDSEGPSSLGWTILRLAKDADAKLCIIGNLEALTNRQSWQVPVTHMLEALARAGLVVMVHGDSTQLAAIAPISKFASGGKMNAQRWLPIYCRDAERWIAAFHLCRRTKSPDSPLAAFTQLWNAQSVEALAALKPIVLAGRQPDAEDWVAWQLIRDLSGETVKVDSGPGWDARPTAPGLALSLGNAWPAAHLAFNGFKNENPDPNLKVLWSCVQAVVAQNPHAADSIARHFEVEHDLRIFGSVCRGLALTGRMAEADERIRQLVTQLSMPDWFRERFQAELRIVPGNNELMLEAKERIGNLALMPEIPLIHRAEIQFNLGVVQGLLQEPAEAASRYQAAFQLNPDLACAKEKIASLHVPLQSERPNP